jgi:hypothetical protein
LAAAPLLPEIRLSVAADAWTVSLPPASDELGEKILSLPDVNVFFGLAARKTATADASGYQGKGKANLPVTTSPVNAQNSPADFLFYNFKESRAPFARPRVWPDSRQR